MVAGGLGIGVVLVGAGVVSLGGAPEGVLLGGAPGVVPVVVPVTADKENASIILFASASIAPLRLTFSPQLYFGH